MSAKKVNLAKVLETIQSVCAGQEPLVNIAFELNVPPHEFLDVITPSVSAFTLPFESSLTDVQLLLNLILLHLLASYRTELLSQKKKLVGFENKLKRLNTPYQG